MSKSAAEHVSDFLIEFLPGLLPKPIDGAAKATVSTFKDQLDALLAQPRIQRELLEAARTAESNFRTEARQQMKSDELVQAVASFPLWDRGLFQSTLQSLPEHLNEDFLAHDLQKYIADDWKGKFTPAELREGIAIYLNCLRVQLLKVDGFADLVTQLATLRIDKRTVAIQTGVEELLRRSEKQTQNTARIQVVIEGNFRGFTATKREEVIGILATLLRIDKDQVRILRVSSGSIIIDLQLPIDAAKKLYELYRERDPRLTDSGISSVIYLADEYKQEFITSLFTIPLPVQDFTGRTDELDELKVAFSRGAMITGVTGGGGIGKTELARKLAQDVAESFPDARMEIDLLGISQTPLKPEDVMRSLLEPFYPGQKLPDDPKQLYGLYQETFSSRKALLLLDNAVDTTQVKPLIPPAPSAAIVTSRRHFTLSEFDLHPLRLDVLPLDQARLLLRAAAPKLQKASDNDVDQLAKLCGRLPLALRVAAALLSDRDDWSLATLLNRLAGERTRLQRLKRPEDLDVEATLSLSYKLLTPDLQKHFRYLSVFTAPFPSISAKAVWGMGEADDPDNIIGKLVNRSLLNFLPAQEGEGGLYDLHDLTRLYASDQLLENKAEAKEALARHAEHFLEWASAANSEYLKGNDHILMGLAHFRFIWSHLFSIYERLLPEQETFPRPEIADKWLSDLPGRCIYVLDLHLPPREKISLLEHALEASRRSGNKQAEEVHMGNLGLAYAALGEARKAIKYGEQALSIAREIGDRRNEGNWLGNLGLAYADLGESRKAIGFYEKHLVIAREIGDRIGVGTALSNLGNAYYALGGFRKAIEFNEQALAIDREIGNRRGEGESQGSLGLAYAALGDAWKAAQFYEQALSIAREIGDRRNEGTWLGNLGNAYADLGEARKANEFREKHLVIAREIGDRIGEVAALTNLGSAYLTLEDARKAIEFYEQALVIAREIGDRRGEATDSWNLGLAYETLGEIERAIFAMQVQVDFEREIGHPDAEQHAQYIEELRKKLG